MITLIVMLCLIGIPVGGLLIMVCIDIFRVDDRMPVEHPDLGPLYRRTA